MTLEPQPEEAAIEARREAERKADMERQAELRRMVESINAWPLLCLALTADGIRKAIARYEQTDVPSGPGIPPHYYAEATSAKVRALGKLREMLATRVDWEAEQARLADPEAKPGATVMRVRFEKRGGHYHCRVFTAPRPGATFAWNGDLVVDEHEWPDIPLLMRGAEFVEEASEWP